MFNRQQLRKVIHSCSDKQTTEYVRKILSTFGNESQTETAAFITKTMQEIGFILKSAQEHPQMRMKTHKIITYLILMADPLIYQIFQTEIYPTIKQFCLFNPKLALEKKGQTFFNKTKYYLQGSQEEKKSLWQLGSKFILFCLETVLVLASWLPTEAENQNQQSFFSISHQNLVKQGIQFPEENNLTFYTDYIVDAIQNTIKQVQEEVLGSGFSQIKSQTRNEFSGSSNLALDSKKIGLKKDSNSKRYSDQHLKSAGQQQAKSKVFRRKSTLNRKSGSISFKEDSLGFEKSKDRFSKKQQQNNFLQQYRRQNKALKDQLNSFKKTQSQQLQNIKFQYHQKINHLQMQLSKKQGSIKDLQNHIKQLELRLDKSTNNSLFNETLKAKQNIIKQLQAKNQKLQFQVQQSRRRQTQLLGYNCSEPILKSKNQQCHTRLNSVQETTRNVPAQTYQSEEHYTKILLKQKSEQYFRKSKNQADLGQFQKIKLQNIKFRQKLLNDCVEPTQFKIIPANKYDFNRLQNHQNLKHLGYFPSTTGSSGKNSELNSQLQRIYPLFQPYISNLPSQNKMRLKKAIMRDKQLLLKTRKIQIGCLTYLLQNSQILKSNQSPRHKYQSQNSKYPELKLVLVVTNVSESDFQDFSFSLVHHNKQLSISSKPDINNSMMISSGQQIKIELTISLLRNNFRSLIGKIKYKQGILETGEQNKIILLMPLTKLKFMQRCVLTPIPQKVKSNKIEKVFIPDRKIIPTFDKISSYFQDAVEKVDKNGLKTFTMKLEFLKKHYFIQVAELDINARASILYEQGQHSLAQCLLQQFTFILGKQ